MFAKGQYGSLATPILRHPTEVLSARMYEDNGDSKPNAETGDLSNLSSMVDNLAREERPATMHQSTGKFVDAIGPSLEFRAFGKLCLTSHHNIAQCLGCQFFFF